MKKKNRLIQFGFIFAIVFAFAAMQSANAATVTWDGGGADNNWSTALNWDTDALPTSADDVVIGDGVAALLDGNGSTYTILSLTIGGGAGNSSLTPVDGDTVSLVVNGNITIDATGGGNDILTAVNSAGRINVTVGDDAVLTPTADYGTSGLSFHNLTVTDASVTFAGDFIMRVTGDFTVSGTSAFTAAAAGAGTLMMYGGSKTTQTIDVSASSYCEFVNLTVDNAANVITAKSFTVTELFTVDGAGESFRATRDTIYLDIKNVAAAFVTPANTGSGATFEFYDLFINGTNAGGSFAPATDYTVKGHFIKIGAAAYAATAGEVTFSNTSTKEILKSGTGGLEFYDFAVADASTVETYADFSIDNDIDIQGTGSFAALGGTITKSATAVDADAITVAANASLEFYNFTAAAAAKTITAENMTVAGNFTIGAGLTFTGQASSTVTFDNLAQRTITNAGTLNFANFVVTDASDVTTASSFNVNDQGSVANFSVDGTGSFTATAGTIDFDGSTVKTIVKDDNATLDFFNVTIADAAANVVITSSSFDINGTAFTLSGATDGSFAAYDGAVTFGGATVLTAPSAARMRFNDIIVDDKAVTIAAGDFIELIGDLTVNGTGTPGSFTPAADATVTFNGTSQQTIGGTSNATYPANFGVLVINKTQGTVPEDNVLLATDIGFQNTGALTLTDGYLNLGTGNSLTLNGTTVTTTTGAINGNAGTVIVTGNANTIALADALFTPDVPASSDPTLYNFTVQIAETVDGTLSINGDLLLDGADLTVTGQIVYLDGNLTQTAVGDQLTDGATASTLVLRGTGTVTGGLSNTFYSAGTNASNLIIERSETLGGNLMVSGDLTINTGVNFFDISIYTLDLDADIVMNSGSIIASSGTVDLAAASFTKIPANMFRNNTVKNLTLGNTEYHLGGDLIVTTTLTQGTVNNMYTEGNTVTFGASATVPTFTSTDHIIGTLKRTVTDAATIFPVGGGTDNLYRPLTLQFKNPGSSMVVTVSSDITNPAYDRGGDPSKFVQAEWTVDVTGTVSTDSLKATFGWGADHNNGLTFADDGATIPARWDNTYWRDFRNTVITGAYSAPAPPDHQLVMASYESFAIDGDSLAGTWAIFDAASNSTTDIDAARAINVNKVVITDVDPNPVASGFPFTVTVQLQDQYGNPVQVATGSGAQTISVASALGSALDITPKTGVIPEESNSVSISGCAITNANGESGIQLLAQNTTDATWQPGISEPIYIIADLPGTQANNIALTAGTNANTALSMSVDLAAGNCIVVARAGSAVSDLPQDGTTYVANSIFGAGSIIGEGAVVYKGAPAGTATIEVTGLAPNTTYHFRAFAYAGTDGNEKYMTFPAANNPNSSSTSGAGVDDDAIFGTNDTWATAKAIGTNSAISGTIKSSTDEDWFNFTVTNAAPNIKVKLTGLPGNYNIEIYDENQVMIRRGIRSSTGSEGPVINDLPPGTYTVKVYGQDGAYSATQTYTLEVTTKGTEIFSITP